MMSNTPRTANAGVILVSRCTPGTWVDVAVAELVEVEVEVALAKVDVGTDEELVSDAAGTGMVVKR